MSDPSPTATHSAPAGAKYVLRWKVAKNYLVTTRLQIAGAPVDIEDTTNYPMFNIKNKNPTWHGCRTLVLAVQQRTADDQPFTDCDFPGEQSALVIDQPYFFPAGETSYDLPAADGAPANGASNAPPKAPKIGDQNSETGAVLTTGYRQFTCTLTAPKESCTYRFTASGLDDGRPPLFVVDVHVTATDLNPKRQHMLDVIAQWLPATLLNNEQRRAHNLPEKTLATPDGNSMQSFDVTKPGSPKTNIFALAAWTEGKGVSSQGDKVHNSFTSAFYEARDDVYKSEGIDKLAEKLDVKPIPGAGLIPINTSCGDILAALLTQWGVDWNGDGSKKTVAFGVGLEGALKGYYVSAFDAFNPVDPLDPTKKRAPTYPKPGDLMVLRETGPNTPPPYMYVGPFAHVCIVTSVSDTVWATADGGGGVLPDQLAEVSDKTLAFTQPSTEAPKTFNGMDWDIVKPALVKQRLLDLFVMNGPEPTPADPNDPSSSPGPDSRTLAYYPEGLPCMLSTTDIQAKMIDGWVDLDRVPNLNKEFVTTPADTKMADKFARLWGRLGVHVPQSK